MQNGMSKISLSMHMHITVLPRNGAILILQQFYPHECQGLYFFFSSDFPLEAVGVTLSACERRKMEGAGSPSSSLVSIPRMMSSPANPDTYYIITSIVTAWPVHWASITYTHSIVGHTNIEYVCTYTCTEKRDA